MERVAALTWIKWPTSRGSGGRNQWDRHINLEISGLPDKFLMEIEENVNPGTGNGGFQRYLLTTEKICNC